MTSTQLTALVIALGAIAASAVASRIAALAPWRSLFPAWRFFDRATLSPRLFIRIATTPSEMGPWRPLDELIGPRPVTSVLFAPHANLALAYQTAVDQLVSELGDLDLDGATPADGIEHDPRVTSLASYQLVARIAAAHVGGAHQWKIIVPEETGDYIVSPVSEVAA